MTSPGSQCNTQASTATTGGAYFAVDYKWRLSTKRWNSAALRSDVWQNERAQGGLASTVTVLPNTLARRAIKVFRESSLLHFE